MKRFLGFTLIELMITLALAAIILSLGIPSFRNVIQNNRAATQSNELVAALGLARSEAVRRGANVRLCPSTNQATCTGGNNWANGWIALVELPAGQPPIRVWRALAGGSTLTGPTEVSFRPMGDIAAVAPPFEHRVPGCSGDQGRNITVNLAGRALVVRVAC